MAISFPIADRPIQAEGPHAIELETIFLTSAEVGQQCLRLIADDQRIPEVVQLVGEARNIFGCPQIIPCCPSTGTAQVPDILRWQCGCRIGLHETMDRGEILARPIVHEGGMVEFTTQLGRHHLQLIQILPRPDITVSSQNEPQHDVVAAAICLFCARLELQLGRHVATHDLQGTKGLRPIRKLVSGKVLAIIVSETRHHVQQVLDSHSVNCRPKTILQSSAVPLHQ
mmetsp:Transcript_6858/g.9790  ORF Transcript_6858/g.9790 Transcript_6858/m.9790 type:complete len:227 (+) Transcript_6858:505-1185(+)